MLTINNIDKIKGKNIVIKGKSFKIDKIFQTTNKYVIGIIGYATTFAPMTVVLDREANVYSYRLRKVGGYVWNDIGIDTLESQRSFLQKLENYLNSV